MTPCHKVGFVYQMQHLVTFVLVYFTLLMPESVLFWNSDGVVYSFIIYINEIFWETFVLTRDAAKKTFCMWFNIWGFCWIWSYFLKFYNSKAFISEGLNPLNYLWIPVLNQCHLGRRICFGCADLVCVSHWLEMPRRDEINYFSLGVAWT